jgi:hypothetical protein
LSLVAAMALGLLACDKTRPTPNAAPSIAGIDAIACVDRVCDVVFRVVDADGEPVDLTISCERTAGECSLTDEPGTDGRSGLEPDRSAPGRTHLLRLGFEGPEPTEKLKLRLVPTDTREAAGEAFTSPGFTLAAGL